MQLTINVSGADFGVELSEILSTLSHEEKKELAKEVLIKALSEVTDTQRSIEEKETRVFQKIRSDYHSDKSKSDAELRDHYKYKELMSNMKSAKELAVKLIVDAASESFKESVRNYVDTDPKIQELRDQCNEEIKIRFPAMVQNAMVNYFASNMHMISSELMGFRSELQDMNYKIQSKM